MKKVLLVEQHVIAGTGIACLLKEYFSKVEIVHSPQPEDILDFIKSEVFDIVIVDLSQSNLDTSLIKDIKNASPDIAIIVSARTADKIMEINTLKAGGHALLPKDISRTEFFGIMDVASRRRVSLSSEMFQELFAAFDSDSLKYSESIHLTERELFIAKLLTQGESIKNIASRLGITAPSVSNNKTKIFRKLNVSNIIELSSSLGRIVQN